MSEDSRWALYVAQGAGEGYGVVKVGVTMDPTRRARTLDGSSPFPLERFAWSKCGDKDTAHALEAFIHRGLKARRLPGEWFRFDFTSADDKALFNRTVQQAYTAMTGRPLKWTGVDLAVVRAYVKRQPTVRRLDYTSKSRRP